MRILLDGQGSCWSDSFGESMAYGVKLLQLLGLKMRVYFSEIGYRQGDVMRFSRCDMPVKIRRRLTLMTSGVDLA